MAEQRVHSSNERLALIERWIQLPREAVGADRRHIADNIVLDLVADLRDCRTQHDDLLAACEAFLERGWNFSGTKDAQILERMRAAVFKARGGAAQPEDHMAHPQNAAPDDGGVA